VDDAGTGRGMSIVGLDEEHRGYDTRVHCRKMSFHPSTQKRNTDPFCRYGLYWCAEEEFVTDGGVSAKSKRKFEPWITCDNSPVSMCRISTKQGSNASTYGSCSANAKNHKDQPHKMKFK
jgi:hypothetical protein